MAFRSLWNRQCNFSKDESVWYYSRVIPVRIEVLEFFIKQICRPDRNETVPLGQPVIDRGIR
jgi:hypothetical protein